MKTKLYFTLESSNNVSVCFDGVHLEESNCAQEAVLFSTKSQTRVTVTLLGPYGHLCFASLSTLVVSQANVPSPVQMTSSLHSEGHVGKVKCQTCLFMCSIEQ